MNKTKSSKGITKVIKHEKQMLRYPQCHSVEKDKHSFKVEENDFPSLSEVREKSPKTEKNSSTSGLSLISYSSKLKILPSECSSQNTKFENVLHVERPSKNESSLNKTGSGVHLAKPLVAVQGNNQNLTKQSSCTVAYSNKKTTESESNACFSGVKSKKSECFNERSNMKLSNEQKSVNDNRLSKTTYGESSTFVKITPSLKKDHNPNYNNINVQKPAISKSFSTPRKTNTEYSLVSRSDRFYNKESDKPNNNAQYKRLDEANRAFRPNTGSDQDVRIKQINAIHGNVSRNTSNKARIASSSSTQTAYNCGKPENNNQSLSVQLSVTGTSETKKKKKRKSKLKRQAALQTGKILVLTPEAHSKIISQSNNAYVLKNKNVLTNINDSEEYPELGAAEPKTIKEGLVTEINVHSKGENSNNLIIFGSETDSKKNVMVSKESSVNDALEATTKSEKRSIGSVEKPEGEKSAIHSNNPITLSLFDMLATAKPRKKEPEKKVESTDENNSTKSFKKEMIKKNIPQAVNQIASSKAAIKRGKEREKPKAKRPSRMRKLILMERQLRKENMAMKMPDSEDENEEKSEEIFPRTQISHDNLETCVEILEKYLANPENSNEAFDINVDLNNEISKQLELDHENNSLSALKSFGNISEKSKLSNEIMNKANLTVENYIAENECSSVSNSINTEKDLVSNPASSLTDKEENLLEDSVDICTVENFAEIYGSNIRNLSKKLSNLENIITDTSCIDGNLIINENDCQTYNFINRIQESDHKASDLIENNVLTMTESYVNTNTEFNSEKKSNSPEAKKSDGNPDFSEKVISNISFPSLSDKEKLRATKLMLHSRKFRQYCNHFISKEIDQAVYSLIDDLARFQDRMYQKDPVKAKIRRRLVYGIKEIKKHMKLKKVKCIIIATDIEDIKIEGGLNDSLGELITIAEAYQIPCIFSHGRFNLGKVCRKSVPVSCVGIFNYEGSEKNFKKVIELHDDSKHDYLAVIKKIASELTTDQVQELFEAEKESALFLREVSQRILREMVYFTPEGYRNSETSEFIEKSTNIASTDSSEVPTQQSEVSNLLTRDVKSLSYIEDHSEGLRKFDKDENLLKLIGTDVNTILTKYKVVKEC